MAAAGRRPVIAGNWKMNNGTRAEARTLVQGINEALSVASPRADVVVCPPFTVLHAVGEMLTDSDHLGLGAQDLFWKESGAYTGQISPKMLRDANVGYVIIGHSERRGRFGVPEPDFTDEILKLFGETDETVNRKTCAAIGADLTPIVCVGETLSEREAGDTDAVVQRQVCGALSGITAAQGETVVLAYEPVWAIGTGRTCEPDEANRVCGVIRAQIENLWGNEAGERVRIQYGGSMKPDNASDLLSRSHIDGGLIGGASLKAADFVAIVAAAS